MKNKDVTGYDSSRLPTIAEQAAMVTTYEAKRTARAAVIQANKSRRMKGEAALPVPGMGVVPHYPHVYSAATGDWGGRAFQDCELTGNQVFWTPYNKEPAGNIDLKAYNARKQAMATLAHQASSPFSDLSPASVETIAQS